MIFLTRSVMAGVLRRFRASSIWQWYMLGSQITISMVIIIVSSALLITSTGLAYELKISESIGAVVVAVLVGALTFTVLGVFLRTVLPTPRAAQLA
ncbi:MAG: hypothetical protein ABGX22_15790 [Pirellulaceae bacterium]|nr:hypothetical protein [Planctomycetaceae bacterium]